MVMYGSEQVEAITNNEQLGMAVGYLLGDMWAGREAHNILLDDTNVAIASAITSQVLFKLCKDMIALHAMGIPTLYCDTDSLLIPWSDAIAAKTFHTVHSSTLGMLKVEPYDIRELTLLTSKAYGFRIANPKCASCGKAMVDYVCDTSACNERSNPDGGYVHLLWNVLQSCVCRVTTAMRSGQHVLLHSRL